MATFAIVFTERADRQFRKLERPVQQRLSGAIDGLRTDQRPPGSKRLTDAGDLWRIRVGAYRIVYTIVDDRLVVVVVKVGHRRSVYRDS
jgi:mRNA interferase RelE/StbE